MVKVIIAASVDESPCRGGGVVRAGRRVPVVLAGVLAITLVGGVAAAVTGHSATAKACVASNGGLRLPAANGKCASGQSAITLDSQGPTGATGRRGLKGATGSPGPKGDTGPAGTAKRINFTQATTESAGPTPPLVTHYLGTAGPVSLIASCLGTATAPMLVLSVAGGTETLSYTATETSIDTGGSPVVAEVHDSTAALATKAFDTETTSGNRSDLITIVIAAQDGTQIIGTLDAELNTAADTPACTVGGTLSAA
jgi:hypothetical protein